MTGCGVHGSGAIDLYFYDELPAPERQALEQHLRSCRECRDVLEELRTIRSALAGRPDVAAPPQGDWAPFMARLGAAIGEAPRALALPVRSPRAGRRSVAGVLAMAALLAMVTASVGYLALHQPSKTTRTPVAGAGGEPGSVTGESAAATTDREDAAFAAVSEQHFERSKLVILGLANKDAETASSADWAYERGLAGSLLDDTRLYRRAAQERGLGSLVGVMSDLELVLLQTSLSDEPDRAALDRLQRLIRKRDLLTKMEMTRF